MCQNSIPLNEATGSNAQRSSDVFETTAELSGTASAYHKVLSIHVNYYSALYTPEKNAYTFRPLYANIWFI